MTSIIPHEALVLLIEWMGVIAVTLLLSASPAVRARRPVAFKYPRRELYVSLGLALLLLVGTTALFTHFFTDFTPAAPAAAATGEPAPFTYTTDQLVRQLWIYLGMMAPFAAALLIRRQPWLSVGLSKPGTRIGLETGLALGLITIFLTGKTYSILNGVSTSELLYLLSTLVIAFGEEFIFRGFIQLRLNSALGETWGWVATSVLFTIWHIPQRIFVQGLDPLNLGLSMLVTLLLGLILGWIMRKTGSILATTLYHAIHNWVQIL